MSTVNLNLARKWRSKNFDQIVGQELSVRMLKNSLYLDHYFPVYLFSGQRGCGKTSMARIFAAAINCGELTNFQKDPKHAAVPCLMCASCTAMLTGQHPDFFEIDAASHTGVDHIRQIIDSSLLLPLMGRKKIYLIDEAHMLSKASFNALLKILEEPPQSVVFILATTDTQKIIDTVKSRCFQLLFKPIEVSYLLEHLVTICTAENIPFDLAGLNLIVKESDGSMRDAINILEQVRFSSSSVTNESVLQVFGHMGDDTLLKLVETMLMRTPTQLITYVEKISLTSYSAEFIWKRLTEIAKAAIWMKHGVESPQFSAHAADLKKIVENCSWLTLNDFLDQLYAQELLFLKTTGKHALLEMILLAVCYKNNSDNDSNSGVAPMAQNASQGAADTIDSEDEMDDEDAEDDESEDDEESHATLWKSFISRIEQQHDPLMLSVFKQGKLHALDTTSHILTIEFASDFVFFKDLLGETEAKWLPVVKEIFGSEIRCVTQFTSEPPTQRAAQHPSAVSSKPTSTQVAASKPQMRPQFSNARNVSHSEHKFDVSDAQMWTKTHMILRHFPGAISEIREN